MASDPTPPAADSAGSLPPGGPGGSGSGGGDGSGAGSGGPSGPGGRVEPDPIHRDEPFFADLFQTRYREVTVSALVFAIIIGVVMNAAITYAGLKIGFTITGSAIAAVLGFGILRGVLRTGTILETNVAQTVASAVNTSNSGIIFTVPVLFLLGYRLSFGDVDFWLVTLACVAGGILGTAFIVPLRKQMLDIERLRFPSSTGVAMILKSPGAGPAKAIVLLAGIVLGALIYLPVGLPGLPGRTVANGPDLEARLDALVDDGAISADVRELTLNMQVWIAEEESDPEVVGLGRVLAEQEVIAKELARRTAAGEDLGTFTEMVRRQQMDVDAQLEGVQSVYPGATEDLGRAVFAASEGEREWASLADRKLGWAAKPWPGYGTLDVRLSAEAAVDADGTPVPDRDLDGDGTLEPVLSTRVDRDADGKPDRILTDDMVDVGRAIGLPDQFQLMFAIAPFAIGAGYITGRAGLFVLAGGILAFFVLNPIAYNMGWTPATVQAHQAPGFLFGAVNRPLGIGLLLGGALMGVLASLPAIKEALKSIASSAGTRGGSDELSFKPLVVVALAGLVFLFIATHVVGAKSLNPVCPITGNAVSATGQVESAGDVVASKTSTVMSDDIRTAEYKGYVISFDGAEARAEWDAWDTNQREALLETYNARPGWLSALPRVVRSLLIALIGAVWIWFAGIIIAQCTGMTDWSPISGMALLTVVLVMLLAGTGAVVGAVLIGATLCVAITLASDMMGDLKTGYLVGAKPRRQQAVEMTVVAIGPVVCMLTLTLIAAVNMEQTGIPMGPGTPTAAPQAQALEAIITGVQGGEMPYALYGFGAALGVLLGLGAFSGLGVLVGLSMYLPFFYIATYGIGCVLNMVLARIKGRTWAEEWGVPFAAGLIVGESLLQLTINIIVLLSG